MKLPYIHFKFKFIIVFICCLFLSISLILLTFFEFTKNPLRISNKLDSNLFSVIPQGWAYFTRNPKEAQVILYKIDYERDKYLISNVGQRHSSYKNFFGLYRRATKLMAELQSIKTNIPDSLFINTYWNYQAKKNELKEEIEEYCFIQVQNELANPLICGKYCLVFQKTIPWAWAESMREIKMPAKIIFLNVACSK